MLHCPGGLLAERHPEVDLCALLLHRTHHTVLGLEHIDVAFGGYHILVQLDTIGLGVAPEHIGLSVVVDPDGGVDVVPVLLLPYQRLTQRILEGSVGRVRHQHPDTVSVQRGIEVVLAVACDGLDGPGTVLPAAPGELLQRSHSAVLRPVYHIGGAPQQPVVHEETGRVLLIGIGDILWRGIVRGI